MAPDSQPNMAPPQTKPKGAPPKGSPSKRSGPKLLECRPMRVLLWPDGTYRGGPGYVVAEDDPFLGTPGGENDCRAALKPARPGATPHDPRDPANPYPPVWIEKLRALKGDLPKPEPSRLEKAAVNPAELPEAED